MGQPETLAHQVTADTEKALSAAAHLLKREAMLESSGRFIDFSKDDCHEGWFLSRNPSDEPIAIARTAENSHLFLYRKRNGDPTRFEVKYRHSADIVSELETFKPRPDEMVSRHHFAFYDVYGNFYDNARLVALSNHSYVAGALLHRHTAIFHFDKTSEAPGMTLAIPIDDIYNLALAYDPTKEAQQS